jgi:proline iminopeptidase
MRSLLIALLSLSLTACATTPQRITTADGVELFVRTAGDGSPIVVIHGGPGLDHGSVAADLMPLAERHRLIFYDQRGGGRSSLPDPALLTLDHHVRDLETLRISLGLERMTLLAHSFGPAIAARYAIAYPARVERMVFLGPIPPMKGSFFEDYSATMNGRLSEADRARLAELVKVFEGAEGDPVAACRDYWTIAVPPRLAAGRSPSLVKSDLCTASAEAIRFGMTKTNSAGFLSMGDWDWTGELATVAAPTLIIHGDEDAIPLSLVGGWNRALPDSRMVVLEKTGHFPHVEKPEIVFAAIEQFLGGDWPPAAVD